jgi:N-glycosylase/DNA lyase
MSRELGENLGSWHGVELFAFPDLESLSSAAKSDLDRLGLGFRGRYIIASARYILAQGGRAWLDRLRGCSYSEAKAELMKLPGVGEKVADCVCLFSLDKHEAVPIDVHIARVARRQFDQCESFESVTPRAYAAMSGCFRERYGEYAGWAQQYFFYEEIDRRGIWDQELKKHRPKMSGH